MVCAAAEQASKPNIPFSSSWHPHPLQPPNIIPCLNVLGPTDTHNCYLNVAYLCAVQDEKLGRLLSGSLTQNYDAVIGSLPKALTQDERLRIRESMPMSPALGALQQIPEVRKQFRGTPSAKCSCACFMCTACTSGWPVAGHGHHFTCVASLQRHAPDDRAAGTPDYIRPSAHACHPIL